MRRQSWAWLAGSAAVFALLLVPYLVARQAQPSGFLFSGFLVNPIDGFSYLAKMRQGSEGSWLFHLPYAERPGPGALLFLYHLFLGHLQRSIGVSPLTIYHASRLFGTAAMFAAAYVFYRSTVKSAALGWAMALTLLGSGLGWIGLALDRMPIDLWVPESIPFFSAFANAHFPLAAAAMLTAMSAFAARDAQRRLRLGAAAAAGLVLGIVQPTAVVSVGAVALIWVVWMRLRPPAGATPDRDRSMVGLLFAITSLPLLAYDMWITRTHAALAAWNAQNLTPTPPLVDVALGFGVVLILAVVSCAVRRPWSTGGGRLLVMWLVVGVALLFVPIGLQRRMLLGIFFPMAALAAITLAHLAEGRPASRWLAYILFVLCLPTNFLVITATMGGALTQQPDVVLSESEKSAYTWVADRVPPGSLILAGEVTGNRLPAFAEVRVIYGHPFETPDASEALAWVESVYASEASPQAVLDEMRGRSVDYVYVGPRERAAGPLTWLSALQLDHEEGDVAIYRVPAR